MQKKYLQGYLESELYKINYKETFDVLEFGEPTTIIINGLHILRCTLLQFEKKYLIISQEYNKAISEITYNRVLDFKVL